MKIHFCAAISQKDKYGDIYERVVKILEKAGNQVQHEQITKTTLDMLDKQSDEATVEYYKKLLKWITKSDLVVAEASFPSTMNVGHEISLGLEKGKVVVVLYEKGHTPVLFYGMNSDKLMLVEYTRDNLEEVLLDAVAFARENTDARFNFFIAPRHIAYLDWVAKTRRIPRSVYLRQLIEDDKNDNAEYEAA